MDRGRLEAFSDGVFAVAITLLALNLAVGGPRYGPLAHQLADQWPAFVAYLISFFTIGIIWVNHHALVSKVLEGMSLGFASMLEWSLGEGRTRAAVPPDRRWAVRLRFASGGLAYLLVIGGAFLSAPAALGFSGLVAVYYIFERTPALASAGQDAPDGTDEPAS